MRRYGYVVCAGWDREETPLAYFDTLEEAREFTDNIGNHVDKYDHSWYIADLSRGNHEPDWMVEYGDVPRYGPPEPPTPPDPNALYATTTAFADAEEIILPPGSQP